MCPSTVILPIDVVRVERELILFLGTLVPIRYISANGYVNFNEKRPAIRRRAFNMLFERSRT